uniref:Putative ankyrin repeat protein n=1 Tax=Trypanosoma congolense (strain IL3000) TaxID=1068625 RepID=G0UUS9_TRYCI|nr:putative ankyrin repeat protein [Trypanosoma congolense IL3000]
MEGSERLTIYDACRRGDETRVNEYVGNGGCVTDYDSHRMTLLHHAAFSGNIRVVELILSAQEKGQKIDIDALDADGWTPLHYAADRGFVAVVEKLVEEGANVNCRDQMRRTPLHLAAGRGQVDVVKRLLKVGASCAMKNAAGQTPLQCAVTNNHAETASVLQQ